MKKTLLAISLSVMMLLSAGCSKENTAVSVIGGADGTTSAVVAGQAEAWEYELYIEEIDYSMEKYLQDNFEFRYALAYQETAAAKEYLESAIAALGELDKTVCTPDLEEVHSNFLYAVGLAKEYDERYMESLGYTEKGDYNSPEVEALIAELNAIREKIGESEEIYTAWINAKKAAFSCLPNGEYKAYSAELEILVFVYYADKYLLTDVLFNGASDDLLSLSNQCLRTLSSIENMDVPEQIKSYHDDILEAIQTERNLYQATTTLAELTSEYQGLEAEEFPAGVQKQLQECFDTINIFYNEENPEYYDLYNALSAALDFADAQAGQ